MKRVSLNRLTILILDAIIIILCSLGIYRIAVKATLPFPLTTVNSTLQAAEGSDEYDIAKDDTILSINGTVYYTWEGAEVYLDAKNVGDKVILKFLKNGIVNYKEAILTNYYSVLEVFVQALVGFIFIVLGIFVLIKAAYTKTARIFHWAAMGLAMIITMTTGSYLINFLGLGYVAHIIYLAVYSITPVVFIHFTSSFPKQRVKNFNNILYLFYFIGGILAITLSVLFVIAVTNESSTLIKQYTFVYTNIFRVFVITCIIVAVAVFFSSYKKETDLAERKKLKWLLLGIILGPFSFMAFWIVPMVIIGHGLLPEVLVVVLLVSVLITFAIAIVKYHWMDIDLIFERSVVYSLTLAGLVVTFIALSTAIAYLLSDVNQDIPFVIAALLVALMLQPIKTKVQKFVDKKFFRVLYNYREEQKQLLEEIKNTLDIQTLANKIVEKTNSLIPVEKIGFFLIKKPENRLQLLAHNGFDFLVGRSLKFEEEKLKTDLSLPLAVDDKIEAGVLVESADIKMFKRWGIVLIFPIKSPSGEIHGALVLGVKKSGKRFYKEDVDLLNITSTTIALTIDRIKLQEELIYEQIEGERLEELNKMKSYFVSSVTHELKTPLTSIKIFSELLQNKKNISKEKSSEYLHIIEGESERLRRLIDNVLDFAKIEKGLKTYEFNSVSLNDLVERVIKSVEYQFKIAKVALKKEICKEKLIINADPDAVEEAVLNLLSNAIKYSSAKTKSTITTFIQNGYAVVDVKDEGAGIADKDVKNIFDSFFRTKNTKLVKAEGTGLGLAIVKHIMDSHHGRIEVESSLNKGSTFSLIFPMEESK